MRNCTKNFEWYYFQWPWTIPNPAFKVTPLFDAECLRDTDIVMGRPQMRNMLRFWAIFRSPGFTHALIKGVISNNLEWPWVIQQNIQWHKASHGLSATAELASSSMFPLTNSKARQKRSTRLASKLSHSLQRKGPFIATQLNSTRRRVELSWVVSL